MRHRRTVIGVDVYDSVVHAFVHLVEDVTEQTTPILGAAFGVPPGTVPSLVRLLVRVHAGSPRARARVDELGTQGGTIRGGTPLPAEMLKPALQRINVAIKAHPHFQALLAHAQAAVRRASGAAAA